MAALALAHAQPVPPEAALVPFERFTLDNGLIVLVHEDPKAPIVAVNVWYHVGSKDEPAGRTGFAHLFEHLMFQGTENHPAEYLPTLLAAGATTLNGTTNFDRTNYFQTVPANALDLALFMESERMGHLLGAVTQEKLDTQRDVVANEKLQAENQPFGRIRAFVAEHAYPPEHPYAHDIFGSMEDLQAATLEEVHEWFRTHYGPNNAVLVLAGDVTLEEAREKVQYYFGDIPPGPAGDRTEAWAAPLPSERRHILYEHVPEARLYKVWNTPALRDSASAHLDVLARTLASGAASRLQQALVRGGLATFVEAYLQPGEIGSQVWIVASPTPGTSLEQLEAALDAELERLARDPIPADELARVKARLESEVLRGLQSVGGFGGKSDLLATGEVFADDPSFLESSLETALAATPEELRLAAAHWLGDNALVLDVRPTPAGSASDEGADRSTVPPLEEPAAAVFPELQRARLANGLEIVLLERRSLPLVEAALVVDAGVAADPADAPGTATLTTSALTEGTAGRTGTELAQELDLLGASLSAGNTLDTTLVGLSSLRRTFPEALDLLAEVALAPSFPEPDVERLKGEQVATIAREAAQPVGLALQLLPELVFGDGHPYGVSWTGSGEPGAVAELTAADLREFHDAWFRPNNATLLVAGDIGLTELVELAREAFAAWEPADVPETTLPEVVRAEEPVIYLVDRPDSVQSLILAAQPLPVVQPADEIDLALLNGVLGGSYNARINQNLRQDKGWSYGAYTLVPDARGPRLLLAQAPVQQNRTADALAELHREFREISGDAPVAAEELGFARAERAARLPGEWETLGATLGAAARTLQLDLPDTYYETFSEDLRAVSLDELHALAARWIEPSEIVWVVVGDRDAIEAPLRELDLGEVRVIGTE